MNYSSTLCSQKWTLPIYLANENVPTRFLKVAEGRASQGIRGKHTGIEVVAIAQPSGPNLVLS